MDHSIMTRTRNRPHWVRQSFEFYSQTRYSGNILICDDSTGNSLAKNDSFIKYYRKSLNIIHIIGNNNHIDNRVSRVTAMHNRAFSVLETKYWSLASDDDICLAQTFYKTLKKKIQQTPTLCVYAAEIKAFYNSSPQITVINFNKHWHSHLYRTDPLYRVAGYFAMPGLSH